MTIHPKSIFINMVDYIELPSVRECKIINYLKGKMRPNDKYILVKINPPLSPLSECNNAENINEIVLALVDNQQDLKDIGKEIIMAEMIYPRYDKKGCLDEGKSVKLETVTLHLDFDNAQNNTLYKTT